MRYFLLFLTLFLVGCHLGVDDVRSNHPGGSFGSVGVGATLGAIGQLFTWAGGIGMGVCALAAAISAIYAKPLVTFCLEGIVACFIALLFGSSFIWLGNNPWLLGICIVLSVALVCVRYRDNIASLLHITITPLKKRNPITPSV